MDHDYYAQSDYKFGDYQSSNIIEIPDISMSDAMESNTIRDQTTSDAPAPSSLQHHVYNMDTENGVLDLDQIERFEAANAVSSATIVDHGIGLEWNSVPHKASATNNFSTTYTNENRSDEKLNLHHEIDGLEDDNVDHADRTEFQTPTHSSTQQLSSNISVNNSYNYKNGQTPSYTLNIVVRQFTKFAERKLNLCLNSSPLNQEPNIAEILSEGVDPMFDRIISSLGYIARRTPKRVTDAVMNWRRGKSELRDMARKIFERDSTAYKEFFTRNKTQGTHRRTSSKAKNSSDMPRLSMQEKNRSELFDQYQKSELTYIQADRQFTISTFILWRVLIEVIKQTPSSTLMEDTGLEEIMYNYLRSIDPYLVSTSLIHSANWNLLSELIGQMSEKSFLSVSDRFIADLEKFPTGFTTGNSFSEASLNLLIHGMRYLQFSNSSLERFEEGADFIKSIAKFFYRCENENIFLSYCDVLNQLLLSLAGTLTAEVNHPTWVDAIKVIYTKAMSISNSNLTKYWGSSITLVVTALSVGPKEMFEEKWKSIVDVIIKRMKPKSSLSEKLVVMTCVSRLLWAYLFRYQDTLNAKQRTMETLANLLFLNIQKKQQWLTEDALLIQSVVQIFRAMAYSQLNFTLENIFIPFLKPSFNNATYEIVNHEKLILCIRAYCCILSDYYNHEKPPYPTDFVIQNSLDPLEFSNTIVDKVFHNDLSNYQVHEEISSIFIKVLFLLESHCGCKILDFQSKNTSAPQTPLSATSGSSLHQRIASLTNFHSGDDASYKNTELFTTAITCISWCANTSNSAEYRKIIELLVKNSIYENETTAQFCIDALKILVCKKNPSVVLTTFASVAFCLDEKASNSFDAAYLLSENYVKLLEVYLEVLQSWLDSLTEIEEHDTEEQANTMYNVNHGFIQEEIKETKKFETLELKNMATLIDDVEGNALFFLFSHDFRIRFLGCQMLRIVTQFDEAIYYLSIEDDVQVAKGHCRLPSKFAAESGTRVIEVLGSLSFVDVAKNKVTQFSEAELKRYTKLAASDKKNTIVKLAESSHGVDAALWFKIFEDILRTLVRNCPIQIAIARSHSCIRLVQFYDQIVRINSNGGTGVDNAVIWDYMLYLKIVCSSLTTTNEQRLHIPDLKATSPSASSIYAPLVKGHSRKKSQQLFTVQHQKITSARSIFKMTVPLLTTTNGRLRDALVEGLSCINVNIFKSFIDCIAPSIERWEIFANGGFSSDMVLKQEICCILSKVIYRFSKSNENYFDEDILQKLTLLLSNMLSVLSLDVSQVNFRYQRLRKYFSNMLETLQKDLLRLGEAGKWFSFPFRKKSFHFLLEWTGYGDKSSILVERYNSMKKGISAENDRLNLQASLEMQKHQLQLSAISCIACLCGSPVTEDGDSVDLSSMFGWFDSLFKTHNEKISSLARGALLDLLLVNGTVKDIFTIIIKKCYTHDSALGNYFITLTEALVQGVEFEYEVYLPLALALFSSGSDNYNVRSSATVLLEYIEMKFYNTSNVSSYVDGVCCRSRIIYKRTLFQLSTYFATAHPEEKFRMISELTMLFNLVGSSPRRDLVAVLLPWVQTVDLDLNKGSNEIDNYLVVLSNFFDITMKYSHKIQNELEALWVALGTSNIGEGEGVQTIYDYIIANSLSLKNLAFIECSRQVIVSISTIPSKFSLIESLISNMQPKSMIPFEPEVSKILISEIEKHEFKGLPYVAKLSKLIQKNSSTTIPAFSLGELSLIFLADLILIPNEKVSENLTLLLHLSISLLDHQLFLVQDQAATLVIHLIHEYGDASSDAGQKVINKLRKSDHSNNLWSYSDLASMKNKGRIPESMDSLVRDILKVFETKIPTIQKDWSIMAIKWATTCKVMHLASRSFQVFRCLISFLDQTMLKDMLSCLTNTISDGNSGIQGFSMQILMTLNAITSELYSEQLIAFPQLFWSSVASLTTVHEHEFIEVLSTLSKFISKIDFNSPETVNCLSATFPSNWEGQFEGLQKMIMIGLRSSNAYEPTLKMMQKLNQLDNSQIIGEGKHRVLLVLMANMPRFLHAYTTKRFPEDVVSAANSLSAMADKNEIIGLSRIIDSLVKKRFRNKEDFVSQVTSILKRFYFPRFAPEVLIFLLGLLLNKTGWIKVEIMDFLKHIFRIVDLTAPEFTGLGADLVSPLLRLIPTDYVNQALEVLDLATSVTASPYDKQYLMVLTGNSIKKYDHENLVTLFGVPEESGWSVPMPGVRTAITRNNIYSVYSTCVNNIEDDTKELLNGEMNPLNISDNASAKNENDLVDENELNKGFDRSMQLSEAPRLSAESQYVQYNPLSPELQKQVNKHHQQQEHYNNDNMSVTEKDSLSNMLATLETLDSFFTKDGQEIKGGFEHQYASSVDTRSTSTTSNTERWGYDFELGSPKLEHTPVQFDSTASFRTLLADVKSPVSDSLSSPRSSSLIGRGKKNSRGSIHAVVEPLKLARDITKDPIVNGALITESNNENEEQSDALFGFDLLRQTNKTRRRSTRFTTSLGNESNGGNMLLKNSPISPRNPRSPRHTNINSRSKFRSYAASYRRSSRAPYSPSESMRTDSPRSNIS